MKPDLMQPLKMLRRSLLADLLMRVGFVMAMGLLATGWLFQRTLDDVGDRAQDEMLRRQSQALLPALHRHSGSDGRMQVDVTLSDELRNLYDTAEDGYMFVIHDGRGHTLVKSQQNASLLLQKGLRRVDGPVFFSTQNEDGSNARYMLTRPLWLQPQPLYLTVGQFRTIDDVLLDEASHAALMRLLMWLAPCFGLGVLLIAAGLSQGLSPVRELSARVRRLGAQKLDLKIPSQDLPSEIQPLCDAVNELREELARALVNQRQLSADMAHQLKTPLAIMQARLELMPAKTAQAAGRNVLLQDVQRMARLVQQMLQFAKLLEGDDAIERVELRGLVQDVVARLVPRASKHGVHLRFQGTPQPLYVEGDALMLAEALQNLIDNAVIYSPQESVVDVLVGLEGRIDVCDRGPGVPAGEKNLIFSRFWRGNRTVDLLSSEDDAGAGSGLGLAIVAEVARRHGGHVRIDDRAGGGSIFSLQLPLIL